jgi:hypothetical protein
MSGLQLALSIGPSAAWISVADAHAALERGERPDVDPAATVISISVDGRELFAGAASWGPLDRLAAELEPAAARLEAGEPAVIRTARTDTINGIALLMTAHGQDVDVAMTSIAELPWAGWFPDDPVHGAELYDYVESHRDELLAAGALLGGEPTTLSRAELVAALRREAHLGAVVHARLSADGASSPPD